MKFKSTRGETVLSRLPCDSRQKSDVLSKLCQAGFDSVVTGGRSIIYMGEGFACQQKKYTQVLVFLLLSTWDR